MPEQHDRDPDRDIALVRPDAERDPPAEEAATEQDQGRSPGRPGKWQRNQESIANLVTLETPPMFLDRERPADPNQVVFVNLQDTAETVATRQAADAAKDYMNQPIIGGKFKAFFVNLGRHFNEQRQRYLARVGVRSAYSDALRGIDAGAEATAATPYVTAEKEAVLARFLDSTAELDKQSGEKAELSSEGFSTAIRQLLTAYASASQEEPMAREEFVSRKNALVRSHLGNDFAEFCGDNLITTADRLRGLFHIADDPGKTEYEQALVDLTITQGTAKSSIHSDHSNWFTRYTDRIRSTPGLNVVGTPAFWASVASVSTFGLTTGLSMGARAIGTLAAGAAVGGIATAIRRYVDIKRDRSDAEREIAMGEDANTIDDHPDVDFKRFSVINAKSSDLIAELSALTGPELVEKVAETEVCMNLGRRAKRDLIQYDSPNGPESGRLELLRALARAKVALSGEGVDSATVQAAALSFADSLGQELDTANREFGKVARGEARKAGVQGFFTGMGIGGAFMGVEALGSSIAEATSGMMSSIKDSISSAASIPIIGNIIAESPGAPFGWGDAEAATLVEAATEGTEPVLPAEVPGGGEVDSSGLSTDTGSATATAYETFVHADLETATSFYMIPEGFQLEVDASGEFANVCGTDGELLFESGELTLDENGKLSEDALQILRDAGWNVESEVDGAVPVEKESVLSTQDYIAQQQEHVAEIAREEWHREFQKLLQWGGENGTGLTEDGNIQLDISRMLEVEGSDVDLKNILESDERGVFLTLSMTEGTANQVFNVQADANGLITIDGDSEIAKTFFSVSEEGEVTSLARFAEVQYQVPMIDEATGEIARTDAGEIIFMETDDGRMCVNTLATLEGRGIDAVTETITVAEDYTVYTLTPPEPEVDASGTGVEEPGATDDGPGTDADTGVPYATPEQVIGQHPNAALINPEAHYHYDTPMIENPTTGKLEGAEFFELEIQGGLDQVGKFAVVDGHIEVDLSGMNLEGQPESVVKTWTPFYDTTHADIAVPDGSSIPMVSVEDSSNLSELKLVLNPNDSTLSSVGFEYQVTQTTVDGEVLWKALIPVDSSVGQNLFTYDATGNAIYTGEYMWAAHDMLNPDGTPMLNSEGEQCLGIFATHQGEGVEGVPLVPQEPEGPFQDDPQLPPEGGDGGGQEQNQDDDRNDFWFMPPIIVPYANRKARGPEIETIQEDEDGGHGPGEAGADLVREDRPHREEPAGT